VGLCERFTDLNPIKIRKYPAREVFLLIKRYTKYNAKQNTGVKTTKKGQVIRKKAGDNWF
jgi:hypothetical protein